VSPHPRGGRDGGLVLVIQNSTHRLQWFHRLHLSDVAWRLAELEARQLKAFTIEPTHLLLGLWKSVDLDLPTLVQRDDARIFRRVLRGKSGGDRIAPPEAQRLRRGPRIGDRKSASVWNVG
jgi:hypothetical protein